MSQVSGRGWMLPSATLSSLPKHTPLAWGCPPLVSLTWLQATCQQPWWRLGGRCAYGKHRGPSKRSSFHLQIQICLLQSSHWCSCSCTRKASGASSSSRRMDVLGSSLGSTFGDSWTGAVAAVSPGWSQGKHSKRLALESSSLDTMDSPPPYFDQPPLKSTGGLLGDDSANVSGRKTLGRN